MCEVFTDVPAHLGKDETGRLAWHCVVGDGAVECEEGEIEYADWKIVVDYSSILPITRLRFEDDASVAERMIQELIISGRMTVIGDRERLPGFLEGLHDEMADVTE